MMLLKVKMLTADEMRKISEKREKELEDEYRSSNGLWEFIWGEMFKAAESGEKTCYLRKYDLFDSLGNPSSKNWGILVKVMKNFLQGSFGYEVFDMEDMIKIQWYRRGN